MCNSTRPIFRLVQCQLLTNVCLIYALFLSSFSILFTHRCWAVPVQLDIPAYLLHTSNKFLNHQQGTLDCMPSAQLQTPAITCNGHSDSLNSFYISHFRYTLRMFQY